MTEKTLFGAIAALLVSILALGIYTAVKNPATVEALPANAVGVVSNALGLSNNDTVATVTSAPTTTRNIALAPSTSSSGTYTMAQVAAHASASSCYTAISGSVYNLTSFITQHPGGRAAILSLCGVDGTAPFLAQHAGQRKPERELASLLIGTLAQ